MATPCHNESPSPSQNIKKTSENQRMMRGQNNVDKGVLFHPDLRIGCHFETRQILREMG